MPFARVMQALGQRGFTSVLVEGGGTVAADALRAGIVDRALLFVAPALLGGDGVPAVGALGIARAADAIRLDPRHRTTSRRRTSWSTGDRGGADTLCLRPGRAVP